MKLGRVTRLSGPSRRRRDRGIEDGQTYPLSKAFGFLQSPTFPYMIVVIYLGRSCVLFEVISIVKQDTSRIP